MTKLKNTPTNINAFLGVGAAAGAITGIFKTKEFETIGSKIIFVCLCAAAGFAVGAVGAVIFVEEPNK